ncbi:MAG: glycoside hydrolase N-terminal domain-containing protein [Clostridia bacterium]|nr:glycoside hydrolase N-terminal domain-containing protein [Clostridia bacterium]
MGIGANLLWYNHPAKHWYEALPLGNGSLGAMVFSGIEKETVGLNLDTLWSGYSHKYTVENKKEVFEEIRNLTMNGDCLSASALAENSFTGDDCEWYLMLGNMIISSRKHLCAKEFHRELDLNTAVGSCKFTANKTEYKREYFISFPHKVLAYRMTAGGKNKMCFNLTVNSEIRNSISVDGDTLILKGVCPSHIENQSGKPICTYFDGERKGIEFECAVKIVTDGTITQNKNNLCVENASEAVIYLTAESNFEKYNIPTYKSEKDCHGICLDRLSKAATDGYDEVKKAHIKDYSEYYSRVSIDLGTSKKDNVPTKRRLHDFLKNKENDNDLYCLLFNYGRYLTIAASREGSQAMTLQGIWTYQMCSPWRSNYTTNINTEMNYWPTLVCSMPELYEPLISFVKDISETGKEVAEKYYGADGFCCHHNVDLWRISTPAKGNPVWSFWPMCGAWLCRNLYEYYLYTQDESYLRDTAYPIMLSAARFCLDMLIDDGNGYLILAPSTSPEHEFLVDGKKCPMSKTTYMTMGIIRDLFRNIIRCSEILGASSDILTEINEKYDKLLPYKIGSQGKLLEWYDDETSSEPHHRHVSHLYSLFPADLIDVDSTPELAQAAKRTLELRGDGGTGWSLGWKINLWARLRDKDKVIKLIDNQLRYKPPVSNAAAHGGGTYPNMFDAHPPFQIDGNFGATSGIAQALMQSDGKRILILPALPDKWSDGYIHGLTAVGAVKVDIDWHNGKLTRLSLCGKGELEVVYNGKSVTVSLNDEEKEVEF